MPFEHRVVDCKTGSDIVGRIVELRNEGFQFSSCLRRGDRIVLTMKRKKMAQNDSKQAANADSSAAGK